MLFASRSAMASPRPEPSRRVVPRDIGGRRTGELEEVADHAVDPLDLRLHEPPELAADLARCPVLRQHLGRTADAAQRVADLVRDAGGEFAQGAQTLAPRD